MSPGVSVVIPAYNEENSIAATIKSVKTIPEVCEVIVVDDGSDDRTSEIAQSAGASKVLRQRNSGKGAALSAGFAASQGEIILMLDGDLGQTAEQAAALIPPILSGEADMAIASFPNLGKGGGLGFAVRLSRNAILRLGGQEMLSPLSGQRAFRREVINLIGGFAPRFAVETAMTIDALRAGVKVIEIPLDMTHRRTGKTLAGFKHRGRQLWDILRIVVNRSLLRPNFKGEYIPIRGYWLAFASSLLWILIAVLCKHWLGLVLSSSILVMSAAGLADDIWGSREAGGFRGHFRLLFKERKLTTGVLKVFIGGIIAFTASIAVNSFELTYIQGIILDTLLIGLFTNSINLLDLRPGRAIYFSLFCLAALALMIGWQVAAILPPIILFAVFDSKAKVMLGDSGSNALGVMIGILAAFYLAVPYKAALTVLLTAMHLYSEKWSISATIERNRALRWLDRRLGVR